MGSVLLAVILLVVLMTGEFGWCNTGSKFGDSGVNLEIETVQGFPTCQDFFTYYALQSRPVKMAGAAKLSRAYTHWEDQYFLQLKDSAGYFVNVETKRKENRSLPTTEMSLKEFVKSYMEQDIYMVDPVPDFLR